MNNIQIFQDERFGEVRTVQQGEEILFVVTDVCRVLDINNARQAISRLDEDEKADVILNDGSQNRHMNAVNEYGLYSLVLASRKPEAKAFKRWITHEVIPAIRKTGNYSVKLSPLELLAEQAKALVEQERRTSALESDLQGIRDVIQLNPNNWREQSSKLLIKIAYKQSGDITGLECLRLESYSLLDERMKVNLKARLINKRRRMADEGVSQSRRDRVNYLDVIADDPKLIEGYTAIVKEMAVKYGVAGGDDK